MSIWPFKPSQAKIDAERLLAAVTAISRNPAFFGPGRTPDTLDGRFELMTLFGSLAMIRLQRDPALQPLAQQFTDALFRAFDSGLRELGVSDTAVPKRMHQLAGAFYGRLRAYSDAAASADRAGLASAIERNITGPDCGAFATALAAHALVLVERQASLPIEALFEADSWPALGS